MVGNARFIQQPRGLAQRASLAFQASNVALRAVYVARFELFRVTAALFGVAQVGSLIYQYRLAGVCGLQIGTDAGRVDAVAYLAVGGLDVRT